jgi:hypothetical protein
MRRLRAWGNVAPAPGRGRPPPGHTRVPREEVADGVDPKGLIPGESWPKARTGPRKRPRWSTGRRPCSARNTARDKTDAPIGAPFPRSVEGERRDYGLPGAGKEYGRFCLRAAIRGRDKVFCPKIAHCADRPFLAISARFPGRGEAPSKRPSSTLLCRRERYSRLPYF